MPENQDKQSRTPQAQPPQGDPAAALQNLASSTETLDDQALHEILQPPQSRPEEEPPVDLSGATIPADPADALEGIADGTIPPEGMAAEAAAPSEAAPVDASEVAAVAPSPIPGVKTSRVIGTSQAGHDFKKMLIPLLLSVGGLLILLSIIAGGMLASYGGGDVGDDAPMLQKSGPTIIFISVPLGLLLVGAAFFFRYELAKIQRLKK